MDSSISTQNHAPSTAPATHPTDDAAASAADVDEPPERQFNLFHTTSPYAIFGKADPRNWSRRESLLTRQLHSETENTDDDDRFAHPSYRTLSTQSNWSNPSVSSTAELTSDDGQSVASPALTPPLVTTVAPSMILATKKPCSSEPRILRYEEKVPETGTEKSVEVGLGRKRCISFACGNKDQKPQKSQPAPLPKHEAQDVPSMPERKSTLKFVCPTRTTTTTTTNPATPATKTVTTTTQDRPEGKFLGGLKRFVSPPPPVRRSPPSRSVTVKAHRDSDSTVTHASPNATHKSPALAYCHPVVSSCRYRRMSFDSNGSTEATRFHEFASSDDEPEEWVQESTCHRTRLTVSDTLQKENIIRKACEEVEEEVAQEEEDAEDDEDADLDDDELDLDQDEMDNQEALEELDDGFFTDDEGGFVQSDEGDVESDEEWWTPGGFSTAATSVDHLERPTFAHRGRTALSSSVGSASSSQVSPHRFVSTKSLRKRRAVALPIRDTNELPDSTDFVCGTLDEDRPLEQEYINQLKRREAAKHKARPQDIDPTFPTSDPEFDNEDDEDFEEDAKESGDAHLMHGELDELDEGQATRRICPMRSRTMSSTNRSPEPTTTRGPPAPTAFRRHGTARSPAPRKLFGQSPRRSRSPAPIRLPSPPYLRRSSPVPSKTTVTFTADVLGSRPQLTHTASLPRGGFMLGHLDRLGINHSYSADLTGLNPSGEAPKRGAVDIVKGLERKRQRRKEKLYQKACAKAAAKSEKAYKVKPGRGAERMREVGLELQRYHGKGEYILSL